MLPVAGQLQPGDAGAVQQGSGVQGGAVLAVLLPRRRGRKTQVRTAGVEQVRRMLMFS